MKKVVLFLCLVLPVICYADAGTPLIWAIGIQLYGVNVLIGILEYYLINRYYCSIPKWMIFFTIMMNYISMFCGLYLNDVITNYLKFSMFNPHSKSEYYIENILWYSILTIISMIVEFPIIKVLLWKNAKESFVISVKVNLISSLFVLVFGILFQLSAYYCIVN
jgi:hypothetical protein